MTIEQAITELLKRDNSVVIPFFGTLRNTPESAKVSVVTNYFAPPSSKIEFTANTTIQDNTLADYLSKKENISVEEAEQQIDDFVKNCKSEFNNYNKIHFEGLGKLARKYDGTFEFELDDNINLNDDAFGLPDFHQNPIIRTEPIVNVGNDTNNDHDNDYYDKNTDKDLDNEGKNEENKVETVTVTETITEKEPEPDKVKEEDTISEAETEEKKRRVWPWILLLLLILCAGFAALTYFELIPNYIPSIIKPKKNVQVVIGGEPRLYYHYEYTEPEDTTAFPLPYPEAMMKYNDSIQRIADSIAAYATAIDSTATPNQTETEPVQPEIEPEKPVIEPEKPVIEPEKPEVEPAQTGPKYLIVCGCFSVEENAQKKVNQLIESGYPNAFYKKRGSMWNAYYDTYSDKQEAKQALDEIRATVNSKAWLLETKK